ncbi:hypothetical protein BCR37DRAFT_380742 [Protomyces lactucae-debilis]|uniref:Uncharacterized protein n=1 Tax=Protomyces lactucae-debilis TaxID=2754530 RepID=A0A1Y2FDF4_PROLT|nr:uncharacterized protein BCR37DRAFT_380742 [Protomyces lactucae-debilis]ORY80885.1 hypothetical protein BCR37DRAFT_380742 [Protomyces lactucae-debilis]
MCIGKAEHPDMSCVSDELLRCGHFANARLCRDSHIRRSSGVEWLKSMDPWSQCRLLGQ